MPRYVVENIASHYGDDLAGKRVVIVGVAYKPNVADTRETPASAILSELQLRNANVCWHDPLVNEWENATSSQITDQYIAIILTKHDGFDYSALEKISHCYDCRTLS